jgi:hypothetical protein
MATSRPAGRFTLRTIETAREREDYAPSGAGRQKSRLLPAENEAQIRKSAAGEFCRIDKGD